MLPAILFGFVLLCSPVSGDDEFLYLGCEFLFQLDHSHRVAAQLVAVPGIFDLGPHLLTHRFQLCFGLLLSGSGLAGVLDA